MLGIRSGLDSLWQRQRRTPDHVTRAFVGEGQLLRLPYPSYVLYKTLAELQGADGEEVLFEADWSSAATRFAAAKPNLRLAFLPNPNSPSGTVLSAGARAGIGRRLPCPLIVDEAYADFAANRTAWNW